MKINILGTEYTITSVDKLGDNLVGEIDYSTKEIKILKSLDLPPTERECQDVPQFKRSVMRHEIIHGLFDEGGTEMGYDLHYENNVNWIAAMYPKMKKIFAELEIED